MQRRWRGDSLRRGPAPNFRKPGPEPVLALFCEWVDYRGHPGGLFGTHRSLSRPVPQALWFDHPPYQGQLFRATGTPARESALRELRPSTAAAALAKSAASDLASATVLVDARLARRMAGARLLNLGETTSMARLRQLGPHLTISHPIRSLTP